MDKRSTSESFDGQTNLSQMSGLSSLSYLKTAKRNIMQEPQREAAKLRDFVAATTAAEITSSREEDLKRPCKRVVFRNKYERDSPEIRKWWYNMFKTLEDDANIPPEEQRDILESMFDHTFVVKMMKICGSRSRQFKEELEKRPDEEIAEMLKSIKIRDKHGDDSETATNKRIETNESVIDAKELQAVQVDLGLPDGELPENPLVNRAIPKSQMYTNFFKRQPSRAAVWRTLPPLSMEEMNLNQKADAVTEKVPIPSAECFQIQRLSLFQIAADFINWLKDLGGDEELSLSVQSVIEMFEIGFHANTATSLKVNVREMPSKAKRAVLRAEIAKDVKASKKRTTYTAFGRHLPHDMQVRPPAENYYRKWITCDRVPEKLASMAAVWQGITHLKSTRAFCEFLIERPEITPPKYLHDCGMMNLKTLKERDKDIQTDMDSAAQGFDNGFQ
ncbi:hypothetical protein HUJ05_007378 [Dendroctonus ponderosae]|nr:hypothetical protein HUJ05_007378 [Dendroctonus ponderosae]